MTDRYIYHVCKDAEWCRAQEEGEYIGSSQDISDGFIHFSSRSQVHKSVAKHRAGQGGLVILEVDTGLIEKGLVWEPSRGGQLFPHLYENLSVSIVTRTAALNLNENGNHDFPDWLAE